MLCKKKHLCIGFASKDLLAVFCKHFASVLQLFWKRCASALQMLWDSLSWTFFFFCLNWIGSSPVSRPPPVPPRGGRSRLRLHRSGEEPQTRGARVGGELQARGARVGGELQARGAAPRPLYICVVCGQEGDIEVWHLHHLKYIGHTHQPPSLIMIIH